jgi:ribose-phosphate pyrophosphokinase
MFDDMISTGGTICEAAKLVLEHGATDVIAAATHGVLSGSAIERIEASPISRLVITDTIPAEGRLDGLAGKLKVLSVGELVGEAIHRIHNNLSLSELFERTAGTKR